MSQRRESNLQKDLSQEGDLVAFVTESPDDEDSSAPDAEAPADSFKRAPSRVFFRNTVKGNNLATFASAWSAREIKSTAYVQDSPTFRALEYLVDLPVCSGRQSSLSEIQESNSAESDWVAILENDNVAEPYHGLSFSFPPRVYTREQVGKAAPFLVKLVDRWPLPVPRPSSTHKRMLIGLAVVLAEISTLGQSTSIRLDKGQDRTCFVATILFYNTSTDSLQDGEFKVYPNSVDSTFALPEIDKFFVGAKARKTSDELDKQIEEVTPKERPKYSTALQLVKFVALKLSYKTMSAMDFPCLCDHFVRLYGVDRLGIRVGDFCCFEAY